MMNQTTLNKFMQEIEQLNLDEKLSLSKHLIKNVQLQKYLDIINNNKDKLLKICSHYGAYNIHLIKSEQIDFLVTLEENRSLLDLGGLLMELRALLNYDLNLISEGGLKPEDKEKLLKEAILL